MTEPRVLSIGHGAERTGPPLHLLRMLEWRRRARPTVPRPTVVLARDGELVPAYREVADVVTAARGAEPLEPLAAALRRAGRPAWVDPVTDRWLAARLGRLPRPEVIHVNGCSPANARILAALPHPDVPVVLHVHELDIGLRHNLDDAQRALLLGRADQVFAVCETVADNLVTGHGVAPARISVHPGSVDVAALADVHPDRGPFGVPEGAFVVGTAALPDWRKAPDLLLRVAWELRRARPDIDLHVAWVGGDPAGEEGWRLAHEARHLGLGDRVHHLAHRATVQPLVAALDLHVSTAREDAFPLVALEAAASGVPLVCFATGGTPELIADDAGLVVPYPDTAAMAEAIARLHDDPGLRHAMGAAGRRRVTERFDTDVVAPAFWAGLEAAATGRPGP